MALLANHRHSDPERRFDMIITILKGLKISLRTYKNSISTPFMFNLLTGTCQCHLVSLKLLNLMIRLINQLNSKKTNLLSSQIPKYSSSDAHNFKIDKVTDDDIPYDLLFSKSPSGDIRQDFKLQLNL